MDGKSDLLKEAIADAKAVKETALANAKIALEEAFAPRIQSMLSTKLSEDLYEDEMDMEAEMEAPAEEPSVVVDGEKYVKADDAEGVEMDAADMDMGEEPMADEMEMEGMMYDADEDPNDDASVEEDLELEAIIRELEEDLNEEELTEDSENTVEEGMHPKGDKDKDKVEEGEHAEPKSKEKEDDEDMKESFNIDEIIEEILSEDGELNEEDIDESLDSSGIGKGSGMKQAAAHTDDPQGEKLVEELEEALEESYSTIESLRDTINEVNLLNAKLLYTNKLFRNFELSEDQKMKVIENFDRAGNTREVKLVFSTLAENFTVPVKKRKMVKEGAASKPVNSTAPVTKTIINEGNQLANRWKKLAGLLD